MFCFKDFFFIKPYKTPEEICNLGETELKLTIYFSWGGQNLQNLDWILKQNNRITLSCPTPFPIPNSSCFFVCVVPLLCSTKERGRGERSGADCKAANWFYWGEWDKDVTEIFCSFLLNFALQFISWQRINPTYIGWRIMLEKKIELLSFFMLWKQYWATIWYCTEKKGVPSTFFWCQRKWGKTLTFMTYIGDDNEDKDFTVSRHRISGLWKKVYRCRLSQPVSVG